VGEWRKLGEFYQRLGESSAVPKAGLALKTRKFLLSRNSAETPGARQRKFPNTTDPGL